MPQTQEHLDIISLLGMTRGVVALTKIDLVEEDWLEMVEEEIRELLESTALAEAPIIPVSAKSGQGIPQLVSAIATEARKASTGAAGEVFRLPVDRVFVAEGYGTIVTGTVYGGRLNRGAEVVVLPQNVRTRVRGIQVHGQDTHMVSAGERCALNLAGIDSRGVKRGDTIAYPGQLETSSVLDAVLAAVKGARPICHGQRVRVHLGTSEIMARLRLLGKDEIGPGARGYVQVRTEEPVVALRGDRYIVRSYSPIVTIGGGWVIMPNPPRRRRYDPDELREMELEAEGSPRDVLHMVLTRQRRQLRQDIASIAPLGLEELSRMTNLSAASVQGALMAANWMDIAGKYLPAREYAAAVEAVSKALQDLYSQAPFRLGVDREELRSTLFSQWGHRDFTALLARLSEEEMIVMGGRWVSDPETYQRLLRVDHPALLNLEAAILNQGFQPKPLRYLASSLSVKMSDITDMMALLVTSGKVIDVGCGFFLHTSIVDQAWAVVKQYLINKTNITAAQCRDSLQTNRKLAVALLEYFDSLDLTRRKGNERLAGSRFQAG